MTYMLRNALPPDLADPPGSSATTSTYFHHERQYPRYPCRWPAAQTYSGQPLTPAPGSYEAVPPSSSMPPHHDPHDPHDQRSSSYHHRDDFHPHHRQQQYHDQQPLQMIRSDSQYYFPHPHELQYDRCSVGITSSHHYLNEDNQHFDHHDHHHHSRILLGYEQSLLFSPLHPQPNPHEHRHHHHEYNEATPPTAASGSMTASITSTATHISPTPAPRSSFRPDRGDEGSPPSQRTARQYYVFDRAAYQAMIQTHCLLAQTPGQGFSEENTAVIDLMSGVARNAAERKRWKRLVGNVALKRNLPEYRNLTWYSSTLVLVPQEDWVSVVEQVHGSHGPAEMHLTLQQTLREIKQSYETRRSRCGLPMHIVEQVMRTCPCGHGSADFLSSSMGPVNYSSSMSRDRS
ncbi:hypothetical protein BC828DRAFT_387720 [Blastocladiella britannica]|nr:hypothetical protein BC828DRAFT_387720 [Blastocladiella britannica]